MCCATGIIRKRLADGRITDHARGAFSDPRWTTVTAEGVLYFVDSLDLVRIGTDGSARTVARGLSGRRLLRPATWVGSARHMVQGLWRGRDGDVYVADNAGSEVKRVRADGTVEVVARSIAPWSPTGGTLAPDGALWILEFAPPFINRARVRRIGTDGRERVY